METQELLNKIEAFEKKRNDLKADFEELKIDIFNFLENENISLSKLSYGLGTTYILLKSKTLSVEALLRLKGLLGSLENYKKHRRGYPKNDVVW